jgi:hypothetical protein
MSEYDKSLSPPDGEPFLETPDGLKYWLVKHKPNPGCQRSVLTEDSSISIHQYGGGRERGNTYLFCYQNFQIGFFCQDNNQGRYPWWDIKSEHHKETNSSLYTITGLGTPVWDEAATLIRGSDGNHKVNLQARRRGEGYVTDITFKDYNEGEHERFQTRVQQDEMLELLPHLFAGLAMNLRRLQPGWGHKPKAVVRFSDDLEKKILSGELIDDAAK